MDELWAMVFRMFFNSLMLFRIGASSLRMGVLRRIAAKVLISHSSGKDRSINNFCALLNCADFALSFKKLTEDDTFQASPVERSYSFKMVL